MKCIFCLRERFFLTCMRCNVHISMFCSVTYLPLTFTHYVHFMHTLFTNMDEYLYTTLEFGMSLYTLLSWNSQSGQNQVSFNSIAAQLKS